MLELRDVSVEISGVPVLDSVQADIPAGSWVALVGTNGAGKSTLIKAVAGLLDYSGEIIIDGYSVRSTKPRPLAHLVAYVPQRPVVPSAMLVNDYVLLGRSAHHPYLGAESRHDRQVVAAALEQLGLSNLSERAVGTLSGGELQRVVLARALAQEAPLLLLDEPTASLDLGHGQLVLELADRLRREHQLTILSALHDLTIAGQYAERLLVLSRGRVQLDGPAEALLTRDLVARYFEASAEILSGSQGAVVAPLRPKASQAQEADGCEPFAGSFPFVNLLKPQD